MPQSYLIANGSSPEQLAADVQAKLNDGWTCQGGVSCMVSFSPYRTSYPDGPMIRGAIVPGSGQLGADISYKNTTSFYQAMVK